MSFIKNTNENTFQIYDEIHEKTFQIYDEIHEKYFMYNTSIEPKNKLKIYKTSTYIIQKLRQKEYSFLSYYEDNGKTKTIEHMINILNIDEQLDIINTCYSILNSYGDFNNVLLKYHDFLYELHDRLVFYYRVMNEKMLFKNNNIYIINVNKHNYCVHYILKHFKTDTLPTMIFFDTHADLNPPYKLHNFSDINNEDCNNIGAVNIPILLNYKKNNGVHWILPDNQPYSYVKRFMGITEEHLKIVPIDEKIEYIKKFEYNGNIINQECFDHKRYKRYNNQHNLITSIQPVLYTLTDIEYFCFFENITDNYILNIDLDYFISHGNIIRDGIFDKIEPSKLYQYDIISTNLCNINLEMSHMEDVNREKLNKELFSIRNKIDRFLLFIGKIKNLGKIPKMIIFCDSTRVNFSLFDDCVGIGDGDGVSDNCMLNTFLPKRYAFWLRNTLFNHIRNILGEEIEIL
jgi:hypothetical protein